MFSAVEHMGVLSLCPLGYMRLEPGRKTSSPSLPGGCGSGEQPGTPDFGSEASVSGYPCPSSVGRTL